MNKMKKICVISAMVCAFCCLSGCKPYDTPEYVTISASQTAYLIPLVGDTSAQSAFESEDLLNEAKIATKEVQIPHYWSQTGRLPGSGEWRDSAKVVIVERTPVTREWTATKDTGSSTSNQAIYSESGESIGFSVGMNCSAQIDEENASLFLYRYNSKSLSSIMDTEIRAMVESEFNKECSKYLIADIIENKQVIMKSVVETVTDFFADRGITITVLGLKEGISYEDKGIQDAINDKFSSEQLLVTQQNNNAVTISKAEAQATAKVMAAEAEAKSNKIISESLTDNLMNFETIKTWSGNYPETYMGDAIPMITIK